MYEPQVNDYVRWVTELGQVHEGWVYYKGTPDNNEKRITDTLKSRCIEYKLSINYENNKSIINNIFNDKIFENTSIDFLRYLITPYLYINFYNLCKNENLEYDKVTIEDLLEKIVGEIEDEYDKPEKLYQPYAEGGFLVEGNTEISVLNETLDWDLPSGDFETIAGLVIDRMENIPHPGDQVLAGTYRLTVKDSSKRKIHSLIVRKLENAEKTNPDETA